MTPVGWQTVLTLARDCSLDEVAQTLAAGLAAPTSVLARVWLSEESADLRLAGSAGLPVGGGTYRRLDGAFSRIPRGHGKIGVTAETGVPFLVRQLRGDEPWLANPDWAARQGARAFMAYPMMAAGKVWGVLAVFDRATPTDSRLAELRDLAEYAGVRLDAVAHRATTTPPLVPLEDRPAADLPAPPTPAAPAIVTRAALRAYEKQTIEAALARTGGRVFGRDGAAALLAMKPTTLASRLKALGIRVR